MSEASAALETERALLNAFAWSMAHSVAPEELPYFRDIEVHFWKNPSAAVQRSDGEAVGFGLDEAMTTTVLLTVATPVLNSLGSALCEATKQRMNPRAKNWLKKIFGLQADSNDPPPCLSVEQRLLVRESTKEQALRCGLTNEQAELLADAVIGATIRATQVA